MNNAAMYIHIVVFCGHKFSILLGLYVAVELLGQMVIRRLTFEVSANVFSTVAEQFKFPPAVYEGSNFSTSSVTRSYLLSTC